MKVNQRGLTRRDFLRGTAYTTIASVLGSSRAAWGKPLPDGRSRVVLVRHQDALDRNHVENPEIIQSMLDDGLRILFQTDDPLEVWHHLIKPDDLVGIKTNVWAHMPTPRAVEDALRRRVLNSGVPADRIRVDDRGARETLGACTTLINTRPLRTHHWAGIGGCLKNYIMFVRFPFRYHSNACASLGKIWTLPIVKEKTRLNVLVVLRPLFHGRGPHHYNRTYQWDYKGLLISPDPVALDAVGIRLLSAKRREFFGEDKPFPKHTHHVMFADARYNVGVSDPDRIDLIKVGWKEGVLI
jgi:hypothetical protein